MIDPETFARRQMELATEFAKYAIENPSVDSLLPADAYIYSRWRVTRSSMNTAASWRRGVSETKVWSRSASACRGSRPRRGHG